MILVEARRLVSFDEPDEERTWVFDLTFLTSSWTCIYGAGCQGVLTAPTPELAQGCCSYGAHLGDDDDVARVEAAAATLDASQWQHRSAGRRRGTIRTARDGARVTRLVDGACVFLNHPGFPGGPGCALHRAALERGLPPADLKPDVCWQLPLRREDLVDATGHVTSSIGPWQRRHWGDGGTEFGWWCTESPDAFIGAAPVYRAMEDELRRLVGDTPYEWLCAHLAGTDA